MDLVFQKINNNGLGVKYTGKINIENTDKISEEIKSRLENFTEVVFDFSEVSYISSAGLRMLIDLKKTLQAKNCFLYIKNPNDEVKNVFEISGFQTVLNII